MTYDELISARRSLRQAVVQPLTRIAKRKFNTGALVGQCVPGGWGADPCVLTANGVTAEYLPGADDIRMLTFEDHEYRLDSAGASTVRWRGDGLLEDLPENLQNLPDAIRKIWNTASYLEDPPPVRALEAALDRLESAIERCQQHGDLDDLVKAIKNSDLPAVELYFDLNEAISNYTFDRPKDQLDPEMVALARLFNQPFDSLLYHGDNLALVKPLYGDVRDVIEDPNLIPASVAPREAYVVGQLDDIAEFFVHPVDGTYLVSGQAVSREDVKEAMGYDRELPDKVSQLPPSQEMVRVMGDVAVQRIDDANHHQYTDDSEIKMAVDDHHIAIDGATQPAGNREKGTFEAIVPDGGELEINGGDESITDIVLPPGVYRFRRLERGIQPTNDRPTWGIKA